MEQEANKHRNNVLHEIQLNRWQQEKRSEWKREARSKNGKRSPKVSIIGFTRGFEAKSSRHGNYLNFQHLLAEVGATS